MLEGASGMRVAAAITTFNRLESLKRCLAHLRAQTRPPDEIIVVDDASQDGTGEWLAEQTGLVVVRMPENRGCSNSFHVAMRTAYERGHDWVFAMDDDVYATPEALERLLEAGALLQAQGARIGALKTFESNWDTGGPIPVPFSFPSTVRQAWRYRFNSRESQIEMGRGAPVEIAWSSFCGTLFSREAFASAGFPDAEYFYWLEDADFGFRQYKLGLRYYMVPQAIVEHKGDEFAQKYAPPRKAGWRDYYRHRNRWRLVWVHGHVLGRYKLICQMRMASETLERAARSAARGNFRGCRLILLGFIDGIRGRMGRRVAPGG
jgi:rhamnopyranosyl-N-acetylglucosaminyl-diphospho-decaprenol beta-1,3/1,4-galactofuranosyltransferase